MASPEQWRWADDDGVQRLLGTDELRTALAAGRLSPRTLVWCRGMPAWIRAETVPVLSTFLSSAPHVALPVDLGPRAPMRLSIPEPGGQEDETFRSTRDVDDHTGATVSRRMKATLIGVGDVEPVPLSSRVRYVPAAPLLPTLAGGAGALDDENTHVAPKPTRSAPPGIQPEPALPKRGHAEAPAVKSRRSVQRQLTSTSTSVLEEPFMAAPPASPARVRHPKTANLPLSDKEAGTHEGVGGARPVSAPLPVFQSFRQDGLTPSLERSFVARVTSVAGGAGDGLFSIPPVAALGVGEADEVEGLSPLPPRSRRFSVTNRTLNSEREAAPVSRRTLGLGLAVGLTLLAVAFGIGRVSGVGRDLRGVERAHRGWVTVPLYSRARSAGTSLRSCLMQSAPSRWAPQVERSIPIDLVPSAAKALAVGYARTMTEPRGLVLDLDSGQVASSHEPEANADGLVRVAPLVGEGKVSFALIAAQQDGLKQAIYVRAEKPLLVGVAGDELAFVAASGAAPKSLWKLPGPIERLQVTPFGANATAGFGVAYLSMERVWYGAANLDGSVLQEPTALESQAKVGKPMLASDGHDVSVVYADGVQGGDTPVRVRWAHGPIASGLSAAPVVELPVGGPGGDSIAPDVAALSDGRWLLMWTEGREGARALRAQTFDSRRVRLGSALRVSPETGNFGQGTLAVVGERAAVAFLLKADSYQLWGTVLQCR